MTLRRTSTLLFLALVAALGGCPGPAPGPAVQIVFDHLPGGLLSVWGTSARDVYAVGSADAEGPLVLHFDGTAWTRLPTGETDGLWWVHGWSGGPVFMGGDGGEILSYEGGTFTRMTTPLSTRTIFGIWGATPDDVLAVGGVAGSAGFVWHYDGTAWTDVPLPTGYAGGAVFKVWGNAADDAWLVGAGGGVMHWDGSALTEETSGVDVTLFTVHTTPSLAIAVGGEGNGVVIERNPTSATPDWHDVTPPLCPNMIGVWIAGNEAWAVGTDGQWLHRTGGAWDFDDSGPNLAGRALHSVWVDPDGGVWAVGGQVLVEPLGDGVMLHRGPAVPGGTFGE